MTKLGSQMALQLVMMMAATHLLWKAPGKVEVTIPLAQLLLRGRLIKLAFVDAAEEAANDVVEGAKEAADGAASENLLCTI